MGNTLKIMTKRNNSNMYMTNVHPITIQQGKMQGKNRARNDEHMGE
jgi:hypothetical protein